ncbi:hypothetical protein [Paenibacillus medicaginis]|uniref:Response regulator n=1 Tax=Paenibacillus medicaginis TaxID=1470560 RepID=A0ABV5C8X2_9BACL
MNILIIEDDENKIKQVTEYLSYSLQFKHSIIIRKSYQSGIKEIMKKEYNFIILDMSLPTFDIIPGGNGGRFRSYAGVDILDEIKRNRLTSKSVVLTQFDVFGEGENKTTLTELINILEESYPDNYLGTVYYNASQSNWKEELRRFINNL